MQAIPKAFFEPVKVIQNPGGYTEKTATNDPVIVTIMREVIASTS